MSQVRRLRNATWQNVLGILARAALKCEGARNRFCANLMCGRLDKFLLSPFLRCCNCHH